jgi:flagellar basal body-associated protein FliL
MAEKLKGQDGRQGKRGKPALVVLGVSVALALVAMVGLLTWNSSNAPQEAAVQGKAGMQAPGAGSTSSSNTSNVPADNPAYPAPATRNANP